MASTYLMSSVNGLVSSKRRLQRPPNSVAMPKFRQIDFTCPMCGKPFGSGGKRVAIGRPKRLVADVLGDHVANEVLVRGGSGRCRDSRRYGAK